MAYLVRSAVRKGIGGLRYRLDHNFHTSLALKKQLISPLEMSEIDIGKLQDNVKTAKAIVQRDLTLSEKILFAHLVDPSCQEYERGKSILSLKPDRLALHDGTGQMVMLQLLATPFRKMALPTVMHFDHLIEANAGDEIDLKKAKEDNSTVYKFLSIACSKMGIPWWDPGSGIIHEIILENYAFPGLLIMCTDDHAANAGALSCLGIGAGGNEAVATMIGFPWEYKYPKVIGVKLTGYLPIWATPKDIILKLASSLKSEGAKGAIIEYFGTGVDNISCTGMATICNLSAEIGAVSSIFPFSQPMADFLTAFSRSATAGVGGGLTDFLHADPNAVYDKLIEIELSEIQPLVSGPFTLDTTHPISQLGNAARQHQWPLKIHECLIGSCVNTSYEDLNRAASVAKQALERGLKANCSFKVSPGSTRIRNAIEKDGIAQIFRDFGGVILANACGPCDGQWKRQGTKQGEKNTIVTTYNCNRPGHNDKNLATHAFVTSPELATALAIKGSLDFNPSDDYLKAKNGREFRLVAPSGNKFPKKNFEPESSLLKDPSHSLAEMNIEFKPRDSYFQLFTNFEGYSESKEKEFVEMLILIKIKGKCTTDQICPRGMWDKFRCHLDNMSNNFLIGAVNSDNNERNKVTNWLTGQMNSVPSAARHYKDHNRRWVVIAEEDYGEGSNRDYAALETRHLGGKAIIAKSFAHQHEYSLKMQGVLPLTFANPADYDKINSSDLVTLEDPRFIIPQKDVKIKLKSKKEETKVTLRHTMNSTHLKWFYSGSAINRTISDR